MKVLLSAIVFFVVLLFLLAGVAKRSKGRTKEAPKARRPLTEAEQGMYFRLTGSLPQFIVLAQVSFAALLDAKSTSARNTFDRKRADFVVVDRSFRVVAVVELDDTSHDGRSARDAARQRLLTDAGYRVVRYRGIPGTDKVRADFSGASADA